MKKQDVIEFFDRLAPGWDAGTVKSDAIIGRILDNAGGCEGCHVLDVACGTGVMIPYYLERRAASVTAIDISPKMAGIAAKKFPQATVLCGDVEEATFDWLFDRIVVYNAFPHFPEPERLVRRLASLLAPGGTLTVAHGMSRAHIDAHHQCAASKVSIGLIHEDALAAMFRKYLTLTVKHSDERMYQLTGIKA